MKVEPGQCRFSLPKSALPTRQDFAGIACQARAEPHSKLCIFHDANPDKDKTLFHSQFELKSDSCFVGYVFPRGFSFSKRVYYNADFAYSRLHDPIDFLGTNFNGDTGFEIAAFEQDARFDKANFVGNVTFSGARFFGAVSLNEAIFKGYIGLKGTHFQEDFGS